MTRPRNLAIVIWALLGLLVVLEIAMTWRPFTVHAVSYNTGSKHGKVAGEIVRGFSLSQKVPANLYSPSRQRNLSIHWHNPDSLGRWTTPNCFAIRFASYSRKNHGDLKVRWQQGATSEEWHLQASAVRNAFREFCPSAGLDTKQAFNIEVLGIDGMSGSVPTVWLAKSALPPAEVNGRHVGRRALNMQLTFARHVGPRMIATIDKGAFAFGCVCSLGLGVISLLAIRRKARLRAPVTGR